MPYYYPRKIDSGRKTVKFLKREVEQNYGGYEQVDLTKNGGSNGKKKIEILSVNKIEKITDIQFDGISYSYFTLFCMVVLKQSIESDDFKFSDVSEEFVSLVLEHENEFKSRCNSLEMTLLLLNSTKMGPFFTLKYVANFPEFTTFFEENIDDITFHFQDYILDTNGSFLLKYLHGIEITKHFEASILVVADYIFYIKKHGSSYLVLTNHNFQDEDRLHKFEKNPFAVTFGSFLDLKSFFMKIETLKMGHPFHFIQYAPEPINLNFALIEGIFKIK
jgi:hypothetical protein